MPSDFLFLIPLTPERFLDPQRRELQKLCFEQLEKLTCTKRVWLLGDGKFSQKDFESIQLKGDTKEDKLMEVGQILEKAYSPVAKYIVRLDDDDLINPAVFDRMANKDFDVCYDKHHWFYDISSARVGNQERAWIANTAIHKYERALQKVEALGGSPKAGDTNFLIACDHSQAWTPFYKNKKSVHLPSKTPLYLRILSPGSITAKNQNGQNQDEYFSYLTTFGNWNQDFPFEDEVADKLKTIWIQNEGDLKEWSFPKKNLISRVLTKFKP